MPPPRRCRTTPNGPSVILVAMPMFLRPRLQRARDEGRFGFWSRSRARPASSRSRPTTASGNTAAAAHPTPIRTAMCWPSATGSPRSRTGWSSPSVAAHWNAVADRCRQALLQVAWNDNGSLHRASDLTSSYATSLLPGLKPIAAWCMLRSSLRSARSRPGRELFAREARYAVCGRCDFGLPATAFPDLPVSGW